MRFLAVVASVAAAGCDALFSIPAIGPDAHLDGALDGASFDAIDAPPHCAPASFESITGTQFTNFQADEIAFPADVSFAIVVHGGFVSYLPAVTTTASPMPTGISGGTWHFPALTPDGSELFLSESGPVLVVSTNNGMGWGPPAPVGGAIPASVFPGAPASVGVNDLRMVVGASSPRLFAEYERRSGNWLAFGSTVTAQTLTGMTGMIEHPSLSPDGLVLVFVLYGTTTNDGVWYIQRASLADPFDALTAVRYGRLKSPAVLSRFATPYLTEDCHDLYAVDVSSASLFHYHHP